MKFNKRDLEALNFQIRPQDAGQIVEVSYATNEHGIFERTYDRSDQSCKYCFATYYARAKTSELVFEPWNGKISRHNKWKEIKFI